MIRIPQPDTSAVVDALFQELDTRTARATALDTIATNAAGDFRSAMADWRTRREALRAELVRLGFATFALDPDANPAEGLLGFHETTAERERLTTEFNRQSASIDTEATEVRAAIVALREATRGRVESN